jgi:hypothetical protein
MKVQSLFFKASVSLFLFGLFACQKGAQETTNQATQERADEYTGARLVQVDSIMIDVIGNFKVYDYQPESGLFLGGDIGSFMIVMGNTGARPNQIGHVVFNRQGEIVHQFNNANSGPEGHSPGALDHAFLGSDRVGVLSQKALYTYGLDGSFDKKYEQLNSLDRLGVSDQHALFSVDGRTVVMGLAKGMEEARAAWDSLYQIATPLWFYDLNRLGDGLSREPAGEGLLASYGYPDHPVYAPESKISVSPFPPYMALDYASKKLLTVYPNIPVMSVYDAQSGQLLEEIDLDPAHFEVEAPMGKASGGVAGHEGLLWSNKGGKLANARYRQVVQLGGYTLLRYSNALPGSVVNELVNSPGMLGKKEEWPRLRKKHYRFYYQLFKEGEKVLPDFELPQLEPKKGHPELLNGSQTRGTIVGGNGLDELFVFIPNNGEEERDYELIRVYKLELLK